MQTVFVLAITFAVNLVLYHVQTNFSINFQRHSLSPHKSLPRLIVITPTYNRSTQIPDLIRLKQTLSLVPNCDWIIVEDSETQNPTVLSYLNDYNSGDLVYVATKSRDKIFRGQAQRNRALEFIRSPSSPYSEGSQGAVYFGDDDNAYDARFLDSLRYTRKISMFNVGLIANRTYEGPLVEDNKIIGFVTPFFGNRKYCIDMAGFAINIKLIVETPSARFLSTHKGRMESEFLDKFDIPLSDFEYFHGSNGIHVWHTQTKFVTDNKPHLRVYNINNTVFDVTTGKLVEDTIPLPQQKNQENPAQVKKGKKKGVEKIPFEKEMIKIMDTPMEDTDLYKQKLPRVNERAQFIPFRNQESSRNSQQSLQNILGSDRVVYRAQT